MNKEFLKENLLDLSALKIYEIFMNLDDEEKGSLLADVLEYYGGSVSHEFLLQISDYWLYFDELDWLRIVSKMNYNKSLGLDSLYSFFLFYTGVRDLSFFQSIGLTNEMLQRYSVSDGNESNIHEPSRFKDRLYKKMNLSDERIEKINEYKVEKEII